MSRKKHEPNDSAADNIVAEDADAPETLPVEHADEGEAAFEADTATQDSGETPEEVEESPLVAQLEQAETRAAEYLDSLQRERAAFQNYKRRVERERDEQAQAVAASVLLKLLPTLDDFYRAMDAARDAERDEWVDGVTLILRKFERFLEDQGVTEIEALGAPFDPAYHEALGIDPGSDAESGTVTQVLQRGYRYGERVLRPAMVRVAE